MRNAIRAMLPSLVSRLPAVRGRGRFILLMDRVLTDEDDPSSYHVVGELNGGVPFQFDLRPWGQKFAYYYRVWEQDYISTLRSLYSGGWFVDVGSSLGLYVVCMAGAVRAAGGRIAAIEPVPFNMERQKQNIELNGIGDIVECARVAVGSSPGRVTLAVDPAGADNNAFINADGGIEADVVTLDTLVAHRQWSPVGAIKIDVEGYEPEVIAGAKEMLARDRPVILAEFNRERMAINGFDIGPSWDFLRGLGYDAYILDHGLLRRVDEPALHENLFFLSQPAAIPESLRVP